VIDFTSGAIAALSAVVLITVRINSAWLILAGALVGFARAACFGG